MGRKMDIHNFSLLLECITYKPGFKFKLTRSKYDGENSFRIVGQLPNVNRPDELTDVMLGEILIDHRIEQWTKGDALNFIQKQLITFEHHEINEWFKYNGQCVNEPHPEGF